ncbi:MAG: ABC transporter ATP-binding protein [Deltaproteobacteria bacterium]|jgi:putative ABC transport system ATP-binding protein|nr:ABC transporter ATP-binding protein [Deltaproteobacteria bacterium]
MTNSQGDAHACAGQEDAGNDKAGASPQDAVLLQDLLFSWPGQSKETLRIPHFSVPRGKRVFLSGPSGSGKSTLLSLIGGILTPASGSVMVNGTCVNMLGGAQRDAFRGNCTGFVFQQFNLVPYLSIMDNVLIPCHLSAMRRARATERSGGPEKAAAVLLESLGIEQDLWGRQATKLSVGQQQRVAAARALIGDPPLLVADEPTSSLDADRRADFLRLLTQECERAQTSLLFVSHDQSLAQGFDAHVRLTDLNRAGETP